MTLRLASQLAQQVKASRFGHMIAPGRSKVYVDPTLRVDERNALRRIFPGVHVVQRERDDFLYNVEPGVRLCQGALRNGAGQVHCRFLKHLRQNADGVIDAIMKAKRNDRSGRLQVQDRFDHAQDAWRYLLNGMLGDSGFMPKLWGA